MVTITIYIGRTWNTPLFELMGQKPDIILKSSEDKQALTDFSAFSALLMYMRNKIKPLTLV